MFDYLFTYQKNNPLIFTQSTFWLFFGFVLLVYQFIYNQVKARNLFLFAFSLFFYYKSSGLYFCLLIFSTIVDFFLGRWIYHSDSKLKKKLFIVVTLLLNLGLLSYFKYAYFFTDLSNQLFGTNWAAQNYLAFVSNGIFSTQFSIDDIFLPVGISFYTFQSISYCLDIYRGELKPVDNILDYAFFVSFFPQLVAGPIVRASDFLPQVNKPYQLNRDDYSRAIYLIMNGLIKKLLVADYIAANFVDRVFESPLSYTGFENLMSVYGYTIQIYCDFSGYTDMATGIALLLGFRLAVNFNSPYTATSITDFWRRWHISLSTWLKDYLYISLGGNRKGKVRMYLNLFITMVLGGLWHGAHLKFIIWGTLHGAALTFHKGWMTITGREKTKSRGLTRLLAQVLTFHFVAFCWIFFRAESLEIVRQVLSQIRYHFEPQLVVQMIQAYRSVFIVMLAAYLIHWTPKGLKEYLEEFFAFTPDWAKATIIVVIIIGLYQVKTAAIQPFIYFQF